MNIAFPLVVDGRRRTADCDEDAHIDQLIEQVLFTSPGERVGRPTFGTPLSQLLFSPLSPEVATAVQFTVMGALQQWLGDKILVEKVEVGVEDATLHVTVTYRARRSGRQGRSSFRAGAQNV